MKTIFQVSLKRFLLLSVMVSFTISCSENQEVTKMSEEQQALKLLTDYGFTIDKPKSARGSGDIEKPRKKISTIKEAKEIIQKIEAMKKGGNFEINLLGSNPQKNGRNSFVACEDQGTYYINRAIEGIASSIDIRFERNSSGEISNIGANISGFPLYGFDYIGSTISSKREFCIDAQLIWGLDLGSLPTSYHQPIYLRIKLYGPDSCTGTVTYGYGHC